MTERVCFLLQIRPDMLDDYLVAHETVWPEMLDALSRTGWHNYSLFVRKPTVWWSATWKPTTTPPRSARWMPRTSTCDGRP